LSKNKKEASIMDLKKSLKDEKYRHLTDEELDSYYDQTLSAIVKALAVAHLEICLFCENRLEQIRKEREVTPEDVALVRRVMQQMGLKTSSSDSRATEATSLKDRFDESLRQLAEIWNAFFRKQVFVHRGDEPVWKGQSEGGYIQARATLEKDASLVIHFSSEDLSLEGKRFSVSLGSMKQRITMQRLPESKVYAKFVLTRYEIPVKLDKIKIRPVK
jgi:hypothetical protein